MAINNKGLDLRDMLLKAGVGEFNATMSIPYMMMSPAATDPYAQGVMQIVGGLQRLLIKAGARNLTVDAGLGKDTAAAIEKYSGERWHEKSWAQLYADVLTGKPWPGYRRASRAVRDDLEPSAGLGDLVDLVISPTGLLAAAGFGVWWKFFRKK